MQLTDLPDYHATKNWPYSISAGCVVFRLQDQAVEVLLLKREPGHAYNVTDGATYQLPKGHIERTETLEQTALRETEEEAGCTSEIKAYLGATQRSYTHPAHKIAVEKTTHYFAAEWLSDLPAMDLEHDSKVWAEVDQAIQLLAANPKGEEEVVKRLKKFLELNNAA